MFLQRYDPWGKTKWDQLLSWNILIFDPQKTNVDEHIDLINTLGDMLGQTEELKMGKIHRYNAHYNPNTSHYLQNMGKDN